MKPTHYLLFRSDLFLFNFYLSGVEHIQSIERVYFIFIGKSVINLSIMSFHDLPPSYDELFSKSSGQHEHVNEYVIEDRLSRLFTGM